MATHVPSKPKFSDDQVTPAATAAKSFGKLRNAAKESPQFITASGKFDSVVLNYDYFVKMFQELEVYRELAFMDEIRNRVEHSEAHPEETLSLEEAVGPESYKRIMSINPNNISDDELFE